MSLSLIQSEHSALPVLAENIPIQLHAYAQFICWRYEARDGGNVTKVPYNPKSGYHARTHNAPEKTYKTDASSTWTSLEAAVRAYEKGYACPMKARYDGIGFVFTENDPFAGLDLDDCRNPETGEIADWALEYVRLLDSYTEVSPSGTGVKIIVMADKPGAECRTVRRPGIEFYSSCRSFALTGHRLPGSPCAVNARQSEYERLYRSVFPVREEMYLCLSREGYHGSQMSDTEVLERIRHSSCAARFHLLFDAGSLAGYHQDHSAADLALCCLLAWWTNGNAVQMDRLFRQSALYRQKWERTSYRNRTLKLAIAGTHGGYSGQDTLRKAS